MNLSNDPEVLYTSCIETDTQIRDKDTQNGESIWNPETGRYAPPYRHDFDTYKPAQDYDCYAKMTDVEADKKWWSDDYVTPDELVAQFESEGPHAVEAIARAREWVRETFREDKGHLNNQIGGNHYSKLKIQPSEYSDANNFTYWQILALRYLTRFRDKNGRQDLEKLIDCAQHMIAEEYGDG